MADPASTDDKTHDATGHGTDGDVDVAGNDAFAAAFESFASGGKPDPAETEQSEEGDDEAGQDGADNEGDDKSPEARDDKSPPASAPAKTAAGDESDPWANAPPALIAARDKLVRDFEQKVQGASGRASGLQRQLNALKQQVPADTPSATTGQPKSEGKKPGDAWTALDDKIKALEEDYPEIAGPIVALLKAQRDEFAELRGQVAPVIEADTEQAVAAQAAALEEKHPDWRSYAPGQNADFDGWVNSQPENVQRLAGSWDAREVAVALSLFKTERAEAIRKGQGEGGKPDPKPNTATDERRARQLDGGKQVGSRTASAATGAPDEFSAAFDHFASRRK